jgi:hypothetical protein
MSHDFTCGEKKNHHHVYCSKFNAYVSQIKHLTTDRSNPFNHRYHFLTIRK